MAKPRTDERDRSIPFMAWSPFASVPSPEVLQPAIANAAEFNGKTILSWMALHRKWTGFLMHRIEEDLALAHRLAKRSEPQDMYSVYANFYQQASADYQREFGEMMRLGQTSLSEAMSAAQKTMETAARSIPQAAA